MIILVLWSSVSSFQNCEKFLSFISYQSVVFCYSNLNGLRHVPKHIFQISFNAHWQNSASLLVYLLSSGAGPALFPLGLVGKELLLWDWRQGWVVRTCSVRSKPLLRQLPQVTSCKGFMQVKSGCLEWDVKLRNWLLLLLLAGRIQGVGEFRVCRFISAQMLPSKVSVKYSFASRALILA